MNEYLPIFAASGSPAVLAVWVGAAAFVAQNGRLRLTQSLLLFLAAVIGWNVFIGTEPFPSPDPARTLRVSLVWAFCLAVPVGVAVSSGWIARRLGATSRTVALVAAIAVVPASLVVMPLALILGCAALGDCL